MIDAATAAVSTSVWRVRDRQTFELLRDSRDRARSGPVRVTRVTPPGSEPTPPRLAFAVGRRVGPAVTRNRLRRRLRAEAAALDLPPGAYLVTLSPEAAELPLHDVAAAFGDALKTLLVRGTRR